MNTNDSSSRPVTSSLRLDKTKIKVYSVRTNVQTGVAAVRPPGGCAATICPTTSIQFYTL